MNVSNIAEMKYIFNEDDSFETIFIKSLMLLGFIKLMGILFKAYSLYFIYNIVVRYGFKEFPIIRYSQFIVLIISIYMVNYVFN